MIEDTLTLLACYMKKVRRAERRAVPLWLFLPVEEALSRGDSDTKKPDEPALVTAPNVTRTLSIHKGIDGMYRNAYFSGGLIKPRASRTSVMDKTCLLMIYLGQRETALDKTGHIQYVLVLNGGIVCAYYGNVTSRGSRVHVNSALAFWGMRRSHPIVRPYPSCPASVQQQIEVVAGYQQVRTESRAARSLSELVVAAANMYVRSS